MINLIINSIIIILMNLFIIIIVIIINMIISIIIVLFITKELVVAAAVIIFIEIIDDLMAQVTVMKEHHFGGYAKWNSELIDFIHWFWDAFGIPLDPIYTGKMAFACWDLLQKNYFPPGSRILLIHTGGLQGNRGFTQRTGIALPSL